MTKVSRQDIYVCELLVIVRHDEHGKRERATTLKAQIIEEMLINRQKMLSAFEGPYRFRESFRNVGSPASPKAHNPVPFARWHQIETPEL